MHSFGNPSLNFLNLTKIAIKSKDFKTSISTKKLHGFVLPLDSRASSWGKNYNKNESMDAGYGNLPTQSNEGPQDRTHVQMHLMNQPLVWLYLSCFTFFLFLILPINPKINISSFKKSFILTNNCQKNI